MSLTHPSNPRSQIRPISILKAGIILLHTSVVNTQSTARTNSSSLLIAATARNLEDEVAKGLFRSDLYYRLNVIHIHLPPLRERTSDIPLLSNFFLKRYAQRLDSEVSSIASTAMALLLQHPWPGNIRELENVIERAIVLAEKKVVLPENLPTEFGTHRGDRRLDDYFSSYSIKHAQKIMETSLIGRALQATGGNKSKASELLEISYPSLLSKIKEYGLGGDKA